MKKNTATMGTNTAPMSEPLVELSDGELDAVTGGEVAAVIAALRASNFSIGYSAECGNLLYLSADP